MNTHFSIAIHALTILAYEGKDKPLSAPYMSGSINTHPVFLRRVLNSLKKAGLIELTRGSNGGVRLVKDPEEVTLLDIYKAISRSESLLSLHSSPNPSCEVGKNINGRLEDHFSNAEQAMKRSLEGVTIAQLLEEVLTEA